MKEIGHWINGKHVPGTSGRFADVFNPATGEVLGEDFLTENHAIMMYQPFLEPPTP